MFSGKCDGGGKVLQAEAVTKQQNGRCSTDWGNMRCSASCSGWSIECDRVRGEKDNPIVISWNTIEFGLYLSTLLDHVV